MSLFLSLHKCAFKVGCTLTTYFFSICKAYSRADCNALPVTMMGGSAVREEGGPEGMWRRATGLSVKCVGRRWPPGVKKKKCMQSLWAPDAKWQRGKRNCIDKRRLGGSGAGPLAMLSTRRAASASGLTEAECWYGLSPATVPRGRVPRQNPKSSWWETKPK